MAGVELQVFTRSENNIGAKLKKADAVVIFTNKVSHRVKKEAMNAAKLNNIPVFMHHSCGVVDLLHPRFLLVIEIEYQYLFDRLAYVPYIFKRGFQPCRLGIVIELKGVKLC